MSDRLLMDNYLMILKSTIEVYVHGTIESSNNDIRHILKTGLDETLAHQANTYDIIKEYDWYAVSNVDNSIINNALNDLDK